MRILIVTPTLGLSPFLCRTVESIEWVRRRSVVQIDHVIVAPFGKVDDLAKQFPDSLVIRENSRGLYSAINDGLDKRVADVDFWTYINDDDYLMEGFLAVLDLAGTFSKEARSRTIIYGNVVLVNSNGNVLNRVTRLRWPRFMRWALAGLRSPLNQQGALFGSEFINRCEVFDSSLKYAADYDFFIRAAKAGAKFIFVNKFVAAYRVHGMQLGQQTAPFLEEIKIVSNRNQISYLARFLGTIAFLLSNTDIYIWRRLRGRPSGAASFKCR